jgi:hypothetical protein
VRVASIAALLVAGACGGSSPPTEEAPVPAPAPGRAAGAADAGSSQSFAEGIAAFCSAPERVGPEMEADPRRRATILAREVQRSVTNPDARAAIARVGGMEPSKRNDYVKELVGRAHLDRCGILEVWHKAEAPPPQPR